MIQLCDFGLCCESNSTLVYVAQTGRMLPIRWLAIESLTENIFSEKSDVYVCQMQRQFCSVGHSECFYTKFTRWDWSHMKASRC